MKLVIQRVKEAKVSVDGKTIGKIGQGLFVLFGVGGGDKEEYADFLAEKLVNMRIMADKKGKMNLSIKDLPAQSGVKGEVLVVPQFTLYADTSYGRRPSFIKAGPPELARKLYEHFVEKVQGYGVKVSTGEFGEYMQIDSVADGPVTIILDHTDVVYT